MEFFKNETKIDFVATFPFAAIMSVLVIGTGLTITATRGLNFGIDFAGGYEIQAKFDEAVSETRIREILEPVGLGSARVQRYGAAEAHEVLILSREQGTVSDDVKAKLYDGFQTLAGGADKISNWAVAQSGENLMIGFSQKVDEGLIRGVIEGQGLKIKSIVPGTHEDKSEYAVTLVSLADQIENALRAALKVPADKQIVRRVEFVGPQVGEQLRNQGLLAVIYAVLFIMLYVAVRFDLYSAPGAVISLVHDVLVIIGAYGVLQLSFDLSAVAVLLTLVGYSINDTIVVYDRIRENLAKMRGSDVRTLVNASVNQTLSRTILTGGSTLLALIALMVWGGGFIREFALAMFVGLITGTYSSIFVATPFFLIL